MFFIELVIVVVQVAQGNHTLALVLVDFHIQAVFRNARYGAVELLSDAVLHELYLLVLDAGAFSLCSGLLHGAGVFAQFLELTFHHASATLGIAVEQSVHHQVGIAADGTGEVGVVVECQSVMTDVLGAVLGLHHGSEGNHFHQVAGFCFLGIVQHLVQALCHHRIRARWLQFQSETDNELGQVDEFVLVGLVVDTIHEHLAGIVFCLWSFAVFATFAYALGHGAVGQQHELLDQFIGILGHLEIHAQGLAVLVDVEARFLTVEIHGALGKSATAHSFGHTVQGDEFLGKVFCRLVFGSLWVNVVAGVLVILGTGLAMCLQHLLHFLVDESTVAAGYRLCQVPVFHHSLLVHEENDAIGQFVLVGPERADVVAQTFGQHRNGAVHQIDAGASLLGFLVDDAAFGDVVRHVGNVHTHLPQLCADFADGDGIVEVLRVARVYSKGHRVAHVLAPAYFLFWNLVADAVRGILHLLGIGIGQSELGQDGVHLRLVLARLSQHLHHFADGVLGVGRPFLNLHDYLVALLGALHVSAWNQNVVGQRAVLSNQIGQVAMNLQAAHELFVGTFQDLGHLSLAHMVAATCHHGHTHTVAIHGMHRVTFGHQYGLSALVGLEGVLAVGLALEHALHHLALLLQAVVVLGFLGQVVVGEHLLQHIHAQHLGRMGVQAQQPEDFLQFVSLRGMPLKQAHHPLYHLFLRDAFGTFFLAFAHST